MMKHQSNGTTGHNTQNTHVLWPLWLSLFLLIWYSCVTLSSACHSHVVTVCTYKQVHLKWSTELWPMYFFCSEPIAINIQI